MSTARKAGRTKARVLRERHGIAPDVPLPDVLSLAEDGEGVPVAVLPDLGHAGVYVRGIILLNGSEAPVRLRFTLAHELSHHVFDDSAHPDAARAVPGHWIEVRANAFAGELLVPEAALERWRDEHGVRVWDLYDLVRCAAAFGVSAPAALRRVDDAEMPTEDGLGGRIAAGEHHGPGRYFEPYADRLAAIDGLLRIPPALEGSLYVKLLAGEVTPRQAAGKLGVTERALRSLLPAAKE